MLIFAKFLHLAVLLVYCISNMMYDLQLTNSLGVFADSAAALRFACARDGDKAVVITVGCEYEVFSLTRSGRHGDLLASIAASSLPSRVVVTSNFLPTCTHFVIQDPNQNRVVIDNHDIATFIRREQAKPGFFDKPAVEQVGFWETALGYAHMYGGVGPNELAALQQLCRAIRSAIGVHGGAWAARLQQLEQALVDECEDADLQTLTRILGDVQAKRVTGETIALASAALCRSYGPKVVAAAKSVDSAMRKWPNSLQSSVGAHKFTMTYREFSQRLEGSFIRGGLYDDPTAMMTFGQNDFLDVTRQDRARCGAASLTAAAIVLGPAALERLALYFGVIVDVQQPMPGPLHLLMEQIYVQIRAISQEGSAVVAGLDERQVNDLVAELFGATPPSELYDVDEFTPQDASGHLMAIGGSTADHGVLLFRDRKLDHWAIYDPAAFGPAAQVFGDDEEMQTYFRDRPLHSYPRRVMTIASI